jgi:putative FmdB family regulatory protein
MPIYEFVCEKCGRIVERLQKLTDPPPDACPECGGKMAKIMSRNSFQLKGGGWYRDLYSSPSSNSAKPAADEKPATEKKTPEPTKDSSASATPAASTASAKKE